MKTSKISIAIALCVALASIPTDSNACTGIARTAGDGSQLVARTIEWAASPMNCGYSIVPRGYQHQSFTPTGEDGMKFKGKYGYVTLWAEFDQVTVEGMNETGLNVGLFFFPGYGEYPKFNPDERDKTLSDMQFVSWALANFSSIDEIKEALKNVTVVGFNESVGTVHWRISEPSGRKVVLEYTNGEPHFFENPLGVLSNAPGFEWQMTNLNSYVNLFPGGADAVDFGNGVTLKPFGGNSGMLGLPGDFTPPSRFVRAAFLQVTAPVWPTGFEEVRQCFHILNSFDIPVGVQRPRGDESLNPANMPSATQFTAVSDMTAKKLYFTTCWNTTIRCIDVAKIDFKKVKFKQSFLDPVKEQPVEMLN